MGDPPFRADHVGSLLRRAQLLRARAVHPATAAIGRCSRSIAAIAVVAALVAPNLARAQQPAFHPGLGDLMTAFVQPRHIKLGLAGNEKNWPYAAYELGELREAFDDVAGDRAEVWGSRRSPSTDRARRSGSRWRHSTGRSRLRTPTGFTAAYGQLTASCNACHQSTGHAVIVVDPAADGRGVSGSGFPSACAMIMDKN